MELKKQARKIRTVRLRIDQETSMLLDMRAKFFFDGNVSAFIRHAILNYRKPDKWQLKKSKTKI